MLRRFAATTGRIGRCLYLILAVLFLMASLDLIFPPVTVQWIIDHIIPPNGIWPFFFRICICLLGLYLLRSLFEYIVNYWGGHVLGVRIEYDMRQDLFDHIHKLSFRYLTIPGPAISCHAWSTTSMRSLNWPTMAPPRICLSPR